MADATSAAYRADGGDGSGWAVRAASVAGVRHRLAGVGPEDAYAWRLVAGDDGIDAARAGRPATVVLAVADGVGSVVGSALAAAAAVEAACACLASALSAGAEPPGADPGGDGWTRAFAAAAVAVRAAGGATTLVVAVVGPDGSAGAPPGRRVGAVARVGDSTALVLGEAGWLELWPPATPDDAPVSTATAALSGRPDAQTPEAAVVTLEAGDALVLVSDGVANPMRDGPTTVAPALAAGLREPPGPLGLALLADFSRQGCFDDRTIVGLWSRSDASVTEDASDDPG